jgi:Fe-S-cluster containining protein
MAMFDALLDQYGELLAEVDAWFSRCQAAYPVAIRCGTGCDGCCRGLFDITLLDGALLRRGFGRLPGEVQKQVRQKAQARLAGLRAIWPDLVEPYVLNLLPAGEWPALMPEEDETPCVLLGEDGRCLLYEHRPMTCRLHGLPLLDHSGESFDDEWCTLNLNGLDPAVLPELRFAFRDLFARELALFRTFTAALLGHPVNELDTLIPAALLVDVCRFDWHRWRAEHPSFGAAATE